MNASEVASILIFPFLILLFSTLIFLSDWSTYAELFNRTAITNDNLVTGRKIFDYLQGETDLNSFQGFTSAENIHMREVKLVTKKARLLFILMALFFLTGIYFADVRRVLLIGGIVTILACMFFFTLPFNYLFTEFHKPLFSGPWMFPSNAAILQIFPQKFFELFALRIFTLTIIFAGSAIILSNTTIFIRHV